MDEAAAWALEERLWLEGASVYDELLDPACVMVFPGIGALRAAEILESLKIAPRWDAVRLSNRTLARPGEALLVLAYRAEGHRAGAAPYRCLCSSTYRADGRDWRIVQHQQTPD